MIPTTTNQIISQICKAYNEDFSLWAFANLRDSSSHGQTQLLRAFSARFQMAGCTARYQPGDAIHSIQIRWEKKLSLIHCLPIRVAEGQENFFGFSEGMMLCAYGTTILLIVDPYCDGIPTFRELSSELLCYFRDTEVGAWLTYKPGGLVARPVIPDC
jgi:hypothetical protein